MVFLTREKDLLGEDVSIISSEAQVNNMLVVMSKFGPNIEESIKVLDVIAGDAKQVFAEDRCRKMAKGVSIHMRGSGASSSGKVKTQTHLFQYIYWTAKLRDVAWSSEFSQDQKLYEVCDFNLKTGLRHPDDQTVKQSVAMLCAGDTSVEHTDANENY
jgi:hypothetical protein